MSLEQHSTNGREPQEVKMPKKGSKPPYKPKIEYRYTVKDVAEAAGMTRRALSVEKFRGKVDPEDFRSVISFLTRRIIEKRLKKTFLPLQQGWQKEVEGLGVKFLGSGLRRLFVADRNSFLIIE